MKPSAVLMDSRRVSDEIHHYLSTTACLEEKALCASETLYSMDAVAEAPVEANVKPSAALMDSRAFLMRLITI